MVSSLRQQSPGKGQRSSETAEACKMNEHNRQASASSKIHVDRYILKQYVYLNLNDTDGHQFQLRYDLEPVL